MIGLALLLLVWPACAIIAAIIAWSKGRSGCGFAVLAILFGPIALIAAAVISSDPEKRVRDGLNSGKLVRCVWCREPVRLGAVVCPHCQRDNP